MTVASTGNKFSYAGDGVTVSFPYPRPYFDPANLRVILADAIGAETIQSINADYVVVGGLDLVSTEWALSTGYAADDTVKHGGAYYICTSAHVSAGGSEPGTGGTWTTVWALVPQENGGQVTMTTAPAAGETLIVTRRTDLKQNTDYVTGGPFSGEGHEDALDKLTLIAQDLQEQIDRAPRVSESTPTSAPDFPQPAGLKHLRWNSAANGLENADAVRWLSGAGSPSDAGAGIDGDFYLRTDTGEVYGPKSSGSWGAPVADLTGPQGPVGPADMQAAVYDPGTVSGDAFAMDNMVEGTTTKVLTSAERTKLAGIETGADVTDPVNVAAAGAVMTTGAQTVAGEKTFSSAVRMEVGAEIVSPTTFSDVTIGAPAGNNASNVFTTENKVKRWIVQKDSAVESGSNAGSNFNIRRFNDAGISLGVVLSLTRSSGLATFSSDVSIGGSIEIGSGGPIVSAGAGSPESSITANVGSIYMRTDGGAGTSMYVKETGSGNTGWMAK